MPDEIAVRRSHQVKITTDGPRGTVEVDGVDISHAVRGAQVSIEAGSLPTVTLDVRIFRVGELGLENSYIEVPDDVADLMKAIGWTPPAT